MPQDPQPQTAWCNVCSSCGPFTVTDECKESHFDCCDSCDPCATCVLAGFIIVILLTICSAGGSLFASLPKVWASKSWFRVMSAAALGMAAVLLCVGLFRDWYSTEAGNYSTPPCGNLSHTIGLWRTDASDNDTFFKSCPDALAALRVTGALIATALSISLFVLLATTCTAFCVKRDCLAPWLCFGGNFVALCFVAAALAVNGARVRGSTSFCGSGRSLSDLGYSLLAPYYTTVVAAAFLGIGVVTALVGKILPPSNSDNDVALPAASEVLSVGPAQELPYHAV